MNRPAVKDMPDTGKKYPVVEYDDEAVEYIKAEGLVNELEEALERLPECFPEAQKVSLCVLESGDSDSEPHLVLVIDAGMTSREFLTATDKFIAPLRVIKSRLYFALAVISGV